MAGFIRLDSIDTCEVECGASDVHAELMSVFAWTTSLNGPGEVSVPPCSTEAMLAEGRHRVWDLTADSELLLILEHRLESLLVAGRLVVVAANLHQVSLDFWMTVEVLELELL